jgi:cytochrome c oxidase cbb3-type subunit I/II
MINELLTRGVWDKVRVEPVLKFCSSNYRYGMATLKVRCCLLKMLLLHYRLDYYVHVGALAWNGFMAFGYIVVSS